MHFLDHNCVLSLSFSVSLFLCLSLSLSTFVFRSSFVRHSFVQPSHPPWLMYSLIRVFVRSLFSFVRRLFVVLSSFVRRLFVDCSFSFVRRPFVIRSTTSPAMADCYVPPHPRSFVFRSRFVRHSFVQPPHLPWLMYHLIRVFVCRLFSFVRRLFVVRSSFVRRSFIIRSSFVRRLFVLVCSSFVCRLFVALSSFVRRLFVVCSFVVCPSFIRRVCCQWRH